MRRELWQCAERDGLQLRTLDFQDRTVVFVRHLDGTGTQSTGFLSRAFCAAQFFHTHGNHFPGE